MKKMYSNNKSVCTLTMNVLLLQYGSKLSYAVDLGLFKHAVICRHAHTHVLHNVYMNSKCCSQFLWQTAIKIIKRILQKLLLLVYLIQKHNYRMIKNTDYVKTFQFLKRTRLEALSMCYFRQFGFAINVMLTKRKLCYMMTRSLWLKCYINIMGLCSSSDLTSRQTFMSALSV